MTGSNKALNEIKWVETTLQPDGTIYVETTGFAVASVLTLDKSYISLKGGLQLVGSTGAADGICPQGKLCPTLASLWIFWGGLSNNDS